MKSLLFAAAGTVSGQHRLEAYTVDGGPGTVLIYIYIYIYMYTHTHTHTHMCVCVCVCVCERERERDLHVHALYFRLGLKCFIPHLYKMHCTPYCILKVCFVLTGDEKLW